MTEHNILPKEDWERLKQMPIEQAIHTIFTISEFNRTNKNPFLLPKSYFGRESNDNVAQLTDDSNFMLKEALKRYNAPKQIEHLTPNFGSFTFNGYIIAGSAALITVTGFYNDDIDVDFYPIFRSDDASTSQEKIMVSYNQWLSDCNDAYYVSWIRDVSRGEHNTTILTRELKPAKQDMYSLSEKYPQKLQLIHRAYITPEEVVVGFDQPCCKAFYDGKDTYVTLDCALCIHFNINPIDWRAESPTHLERALKYERRGFSIVCPKFHFADSSQKFQFSRGIISLDGQNKCHLVPFSRQCKLQVDNFDEFPVESHTSEFASDYDYMSLIRLEQDGNHIATPENPVNYHNRREIEHLRVNLRAAAKNLPTYATVKAYNIGDFQKSKFVEFDFVTYIESQCYRDFFLHRKRMMQIEEEIAEIQQRIKQKHKIKKSVEDSRPHRFRLEESEKYLALCKEAKELHDDYVKTVQQNWYPILERRKTVQFIFENPGSQFRINASFHPIHKNSHEEYWGKNATLIHYEHIAWDQIISLCVLMKRGVFVVLPKDLLKLIREELYKLWMKDLLILAENSK